MLPEQRKQLLAKLQSDLRISTMQRLQLHRGEVGRSTYLVTLSSDTTHYILSLGEARKSSVFPQGYTYTSIPMGRLIFPRIIASSQRAQWELEEFIDGTLLGEQWPHVGLPWPEQLLQKLIGVFWMMQSCFEWHLGYGGLYRWAVDSFQNRLRLKRWCQVIKQKGYDDPFLEQAYRRIRSLAAVYGPWEKIHGRFALTHILKMSSGGFAVIDLAHVRYGMPLQDFGNLLWASWWHGVEGDTDWLYKYLENISHRLYGQCPMGYERQFVRFQDHTFLDWVWPPVILERVIGTMFDFLNRVEHANRLIDSPEKEQKLFALMQGLLERYAG